MLAVQGGVSVCPVPVIEGCCGIFSSMSYPLLDPLLEASAATSPSSCGTTTASRGWEALGVEEEGMGGGSDRTNVTHPTSSGGASDKSSADGAEEHQQQAPPRDEEQSDPLRLFCFLDAEEDFSMDSFMSKVSLPPPLPFSQYLSLCGSPFLFSLRLGFEFSAILLRLRCVSFCCSQGSLPSTYDSMHFSEP